MIMYPDNVGGSEGETGGVGCGCAIGSVTCSANIGSGNVSLSAGADAVGNVGADKVATAAPSRTSAAHRGQSPACASTPRSLPQAGHRVIFFIASVAAEGATQRMGKARRRPGNQRGAASSMTQVGRKGRCRGTQWRGREDRQ